MRHKKIEQAQNDYDDLLHFASYLIKKKYFCFLFKYLFSLFIFNVVDFILSHMVQIEKEKANFKPQKKKKINKKKLKFTIVFKLKEKANLEK